ncbi:MAG: CheR family methyltransferase [Chloroflexota bacterium]
MIALQEDNPTTLETTLADILSLVGERRGIDFRSYRHTTVERRTLGRMQLAKVETYAEYRDRLESDPEEIDRLIRYLTIKVSRFFRDLPVFDLLRNKVLPDLAQRGRPLRVWSAGCGNGEEPYSLAILLAEAGLDGAVVGTDVDEKALADARTGRYRQEAVADLLPALRETYFQVEYERGGPRYIVNDTLRRRVEFRSHNLIADQADLLGSFDLICCRNVLIYFESPAQGRVEHLLRQHLGRCGYLCLGEAEWLSPNVEQSFTVIDRQARLFRLKDTGASGGEGH